MTTTVTTSRARRTGPGQHRREDGQVTTTVTTSRARRTGPASTVGKTGK